MLAIISVVLALLVAVLTTVAGLLVWYERWLSKHKPVVFDERKEHMQLVSHCIIAVDAFIALPAFVLSLCLGWQAEKALEHAQYDIDQVRHAANQTSIKLTNARKQIIDTEKRARIAEERAETAERKASAIEHRFMPRNEMLTPKAREQLLLKLKTLPAGRFRVVLDRSIPEVIEFTQALSDVMKAANCDFEVFPADFLRAGPKPVSGIMVTYIGDQPPPLARGLYDAMVAAELPNVVLEKLALTGDPDHDFVVQLFIGPRTYSAI